MNYRKRIFGATSPSRMAFFHELRMRLRSWEPRKPDSLPSLPSAPLTVVTVLVVTVVPAFKLI